MAVDKSYARLGLFVVLGLVVILATGLFFIQRMRSREVIELVTYITENVSGLDISSPVRYRGVAVGRVSDLRCRSRRPHDRDRLRGVHRPAGVDRRERRQPPGAGRVRVFPNASSPGGRQPRDGRGLSLARRAREPAAANRTRLHANRPYMASMPSPLSEIQDRLPEVLERAEVTLQTLREIVGRIPDSLDRSDRFFTNVERIVRESQLPELSADSRKFFATTSTQIEADRVQPGRAGRRGGRAGQVRSKRRAPRSRPRTCRPPAARRATRWTRPAWRPTICVARCRRCVSRSSSCASSRGSWRNSPSRSSTARGRQRAKPK